MRMPVQFTFKRIIKCMPIAEERAVDAWLDITAQKLSHQRAAFGFPMN
jgi:hypothetical protein